MTCKRINLKSGKMKKKGMDGKYEQAINELEKVKVSKKIRILTS